jgi:multidrug transporter EmrE-like cation transporter
MAAVESLVASPSVRAWLIICIAACLNTLAGVLLKQSRLHAEAGPIWLALSSPWFLAAGVCYVVNVFLFAKALDHMPLSLVYPAFAGLGFAMIAVAGNLLFQERLGPNQWIGVLLIFAGIIAASRGT